jgi:hypothetical protein
LVLVLTPFAIRLAARVLGAKCDSCVWLWAVGVRCNCEIVRDAELDGSDLKEQDAAEDNDTCLVLSMHAYFLHQLVIDAIAVSVIGWLLHFVVLTKAKKNLINNTSTINKGTSP